MNEGRPPTGIIIIILMVILGVGLTYASKSLLKKSETAEKGPAVNGKTPTETTSKPIKPVSPKDEPGPTKPRFHQLIIDPFARPLPGTQNTPEGSGVGLHVNRPNGTISHSVIGGDSNGSGVKIPPINIVPNGALGSGRPPSLPGTISGANSSSGGTNPPTNVALAPIVVKLNGIVGDGRYKAFISLTPGGSRTISSGSNLGDGLKVVSVTKDFIVVTRLGQTQRIEIGKEAQL